jgi:hypothetical protein
MVEMVRLLDEIKPSLGPIEKTYTHNGIQVPRVTSILSKCIHNDGLMYWANSLGFKHKSYSKTLDEAANIGTQCHESIDGYLTDNSYTAPENMEYQSANAYNSFRKWYDNITQYANVRVICHEKTITCPYFGGTLDGLYEINGMIYLIDYKTTNHITYKHFLQLSAYRYMLRTELGINIDGCIILQLDKNSVSYNEFVLDFTNPEHLAFINTCERAFLSLVYAFYNINIVDNAYNNLHLGET